MFLCIVHQKRLEPVNERKFNQRTAQETTRVRRESPEEFEEHRVCLDEEKGSSSDMIVPYLVHSYQQFLSEHPLQD